MKSSLSKQLARWYTRSGNRIVFKNGMSLNQLALQMWEYLGGSQIDPSVISRVISGNRHFSLNQINAFCGVLGLTKADKAQLITARYNDLLTKYNLPVPEYSDTISTLNLAEKLLPKIQKIRESGNYGLSLDISSDLVNDLENIRYRDIPSKSIHAYELYYSRALFEKCAGFLDTQLATSLYSQTKNLLISLFRLAHDFHNEEIFGLASYLRGNVYYGLNDHRKSQLYHHQALLHLKGEDFRPYSLRSLAISSAYLGDQHTFSVTKSRITSQIQDSPVHLQAVYFEGLVKSYVYLNKPKEAQTYLSKNWETVNKLSSQQGPNWIFRIIQAARTNADANVALGLGSDDFVITKAQEGIRLASHYGFTKYTTLINQSLIKL